MKTLCVYCGAAAGVRPAYAAAAVTLATSLAKRGMGLVYGGGSVGLMGILADAALARGVPVTGVIPHHLHALEVGHKRLTTLHLVHTMHERKAKLAALSDGFLALPGGLGTLEELFEAYTWAQLGLHPKPVGVLDVAGYYGPLLSFLDQAVAEGFVRPKHRRFLLNGDDVEPLLDAMAAWVAPADTRWLDESDR